MKKFDMMEKITKSASMQEKEVFNKDNTIKKNNEISLRDDTIQEKTTENETIVKVVTRKRVRKINKTVSFSLPLDDYNSYMKYLNEKNIDSASELFRDLLRKEGIIS